MANEKAKLLQVENQTNISKHNTPEFLLEYQKSILLALGKQGVISDIQCQMCIDRMMGQP